MSKIDARKKGHAYELKIVDLFKKLGWLNCVSSRSESRRTDAIGIDLCYTFPFNIQCKAWETTPPYHKILSNMPKRNKFGRYNVIFHKKNRQGDVVVMSKDDFTEIVELLINSGVITPNG